MKSRPSASVAEGIGLAWALGMAYLTAAYFTCYLCGLSVALCTVIAVVVACVLGGATLACARLPRQTLARPRPRATSYPALFTRTAEHCSWDRQGTRLRVPCRPALPAGMPAVPGRVVPPSPVPLNNPGYIGLVALGCTILPVAVMAWMAVRSPLAGWDGWSVWAFKARAFADGGPTLAYFRDPITLHTHPDYPLNLPIAESLLSHLPNSASFPLVTLLGPACFAALLCLVFAGLARVYGPETAAIGVAILGGMPIFLYNAPGAGADVPLCLYTGGAAVYLLAWWTQGRRRDAVLAGLLAGGAAWTKKEGLAVAAITMLVFTGYELLRRQGWRKEAIAGVLLPLCAAAAIPLPWLLFAHVAQPLPRDFGPVTPATLLRHLDRLPRVALVMGRQMLTFSNWGPFWPLVGLALAVRGRHLPAPGRGLAVLLAAQLGLYVGVFEFSNWQPYVAHAQGTLDRLLLQATPLACLTLIACAHQTKAAARRAPVEMGRRRRVTMARRAAS